jgi:beta-xylosidase
VTEDYNTFHKLLSISVIAYSMYKKVLGNVCSAFLLCLVATIALSQKNPVIDGWYADPEGVIFEGKYWIYPTYSAKYEKQVFLDAFSSKDMVAWKKHPHILDTSKIKWAKMAMWAPAIVEKNNQYFLFFSANDIQSKQRNGIADDTLGGIGIAVADHPGGPFKDYLDKPLINKFYNNAQPIDQYVFKDRDGQYYIIYGGWGRCNVG